MKGQTWLDRLVDDAALHLGEYVGDELGTARKKLDNVLDLLGTPRPRSSSWNPEAANRIRNTLERVLAMDPFGDKPALDLATLQQSLDHAVSHASHILDRSPATPKAGVTITAEVRVTAHREGKPTAEAIYAEQESFREWRDANIVVTGADKHRLRAGDILGVFEKDHPSAALNRLDVVGLMLEMNDTRLTTEGVFVVIEGVMWRTDRAGT